MKLRKWCASLAAFLFLSGGILTVAGYAMGAERTLMVDTPYGPISVQPFRWGDVRSLAGPGQNDMSLTLTELEPFDTLDIDLDVGSVILRTGETYSLDMTWDGSHGYVLHQSNEDGKLRVWSSGGSGGSAGRNSSVELTLPEGAVLENLHMDLDLGDTEWRDLTIKKTDLTLALGDLTVENCSFSDSLTARVNLGTVELDGTLEGDTDLRADLGAVHVATALPQSSYTWDVHADLGAVRVGEQEREFSGELLGGSGPHSLKIRADLGDVTVEFG